MAVSPWFIRFIFIVNLRASKLDFNSEIKKCVLDNCQYTNHKALVMLGNYGNLDCLLFSDVSYYVLFNKYPSHKLYTLKNSSSDDLTLVILEISLLFSKIIAFKYFINDFYKYLIPY